MAQQPAYFEVLFNFLAEGEGELSVTIGDVVVAHPGEDGVFGTGDDIRDGWLMVQIDGTSHFGYVPYDYIQSIPNPHQSQSPSRNQAQQEGGSQDSTGTRRNRRSVMRTSLHFLASDDAFRTQLAHEHDWREKLRLIKERAAKLDSSRRGQEQKMMTALDDKESQTELEMERARKEHTAACVQFEHTIEAAEIAIERLSHQREHHEQLWKGEYADANQALLDYAAQVKESEALARQRRQEQEQHQQEQEQEQETDEVPPPTFATYGQQEPEGGQQQYQYDAAEAEQASSQQQSEYIKVSRQGSSKRMTSVMNYTDEETAAILERQSRFEAEQQQQQQQQQGGGSSGSAFPAPAPYVPADPTPAPAAPAEQQQQEQQQQPWSNHDQLSGEEKAEREAEMRTNHRPMKKWYAMEPELQEKYGAFPGWWKDLLTWPHWRPVYKKYLVYTEDQHNFQPPAPAPAPAPAPEPAPTPAPEDYATEPTAEAGSSPNMMPPPSAPAPASGFLHKRGGGKSMFGRQQWNNRWCMVRHSSQMAGWNVQWWAKEADAQKPGGIPKGEMPIAGCDVVEASDGDAKGQFGFDVSGADGEVRHFYAESREARAEWMESIAYFSRMQ